MELRQLRTMLAAAEKESFTRAARDLAVTQAAVSQQIALLEKELSVKLFRRQGRGVRLTDEGRRLQEHAQRILTLVDEAAADVGRDQPPVTGQLRIATSTVPSEWLVPELLAEFRARWPGVRESLAVSDSELAAAAVESGAADVGFVGELPHSTNLRVEAVAEDELVLFVAADHPLAHQGKATLRQLRSLAFIIRESGSGSRRCVDRALEEHGLPPSELRIAMEANSNDAIRAAVRRGVGAAFMSLRANRDEACLRPIPIRGFHAKRHLYAVSTRDRTPSTAAQQLLALIDEWRSRRSLRGRT